jgi:hypothetical protein
MAARSRVSEKETRVTNNDLFGLAAGPALTPKQRRKLKGDGRNPRGHAWTPGTGPDGETCRTCRHIARQQFARTYLKCGLNKTAWTHGAASDIRAKDPACKKWEAVG